MLKQNRFCFLTLFPRLCFTSFSFILAPFYAPLSFLLPQLSSPTCIMILIVSIFHEIHQYCDNLTTIPVPTPTTLPKPTPKSTLWRPSLPHSLLRPSFSLHTSEFPSSYQHCLHHPTYKNPPWCCVYFRRLSHSSGPFYSKLSREPSVLATPFAFVFLLSYTYIQRVFALITPQSKLWSRTLMTGSLANWMVDSWPFSD